MKYTKKYPIHPLPDKQFSGASIFAQGGQLPEDDKPKSKTYTNKAEYDKALQAYNDTLASNQITQDKLDVFEMLGWQKDPITTTTQEEYRRRNPIGDLSEFNYKGIDALVGLRTSKEKGREHVTQAFPVYKKPVVKPEFKSLGNPLMLEGERQMEARYKPTSTLAKGALEQEVRPTMAQGTMESEPKPINELMMPSGSYMQKDDFIKRYGEKPWMKATGQKFAFGGKVPPGDNATPTFNDSLAIYNNTQELKKFYSPEKGYEMVDNYTVNPSDYKYWFKRDNESIIKSIRDLAKEEANVENAKSNAQLYPNTYKSPTDFLQAITKSLSNTKFNNPYQVQVQDRVPGAINWKSPLNISDSRIIPDKIVSYNSHNDPGVMTDIYEYDLLKVKPYSMLTAAEKEARLKKYGTDGFPASYKNSNATSNTSSTSAPVVKPRPDLSLDKLPIKSAELTYNSEIPIQKVPEARVDSMSNLERYIPYTANYGNPNLPQGYWDKGMGKKETQYANGGKLPGDDKTKTYTNKAEYDKALQAYNDSLINYKVYNSNKSLNEKTINTVGDMDLHSLFPKKENRDILPTALMRTGTDPNFAYYNKYKKPVFIPEYKEPTMTKGTMESEPKPINELNVLGTKMSKEDFIKKYSENAWLKATGQKFAFGGFKYPNGGSFYDSSNLDTSKPQLNKDGTTTTTPNSTGGYSPNYGGYAAAAVGAIPSVVNTWNNPNLTTTGKMQDTSTTVGRTAATTTFPVLGAAFGVQDMGTQIAADNSGGKYVTNKDTGKQEAVLDTKDQIGTNMLTDTGSTTGKNWSNIVTGKGTSQDWWSAIMGTILPGTEYIVNNAYAVKNEGSANQEQYNAEQAAKTNYLKNQKSQNFSAFGGYKNKFPYGGHVNEFNLAQMAYGGNMKSEVTGKSYLKDQVSDFTSNTFNKHETGGVAVDSQNEVEAGEIVYKDYVFSDRLKDAKGNSFAARAKKLIDQIK